MPTFSANGVDIFYEVTGQGFPLVWGHEFAGDYRSWEPQVRFFSRRYRVITYNARGYPPSALSTITKLIERAGNSAETGGAITGIYTVLADGDDQNDPVVDTARSILDGHIVLSRDIAQRGRYPAVDVGASLSRVMNDIVPPAHVVAARKFRALNATYEENRDLVLMGAYRPGQDATLDKAIAMHAGMSAFLGQDIAEHVGLFEAVGQLEELMADDA